MPYSSFAEVLRVRGLLLLLLLLLLRVLAL
jgi:hypothetical protein